MSPPEVRYVVEVTLGECPSCGSEISGHLDTVVKIHGVRIEPRVERPSDREKSKTLAIPNAGAEITGLAVEHRCGTSAEVDSMDDGPECDDDGLTPVARTMAAAR